MKFFNSFLPLFIIVLLVSCKSNSNKDIIEKGSNLQGDISESCHCDSLVESNNYYSKDDKPFTGTCYSFYPGTEQKYIEKQILNGNIHGKIFYYDKNGNVLLEEIYNEGKNELNFKNEFITVNCKEIAIKKDEINNVNKHYYKGKLYTGMCNDYYHETEQIYMESKYENGLLNGYTIYYNKDGSVLMMHLYEKGILVKEIVS